MRLKFDEQLEMLNVELIKMGALCEEAISLALKALAENDGSLIEKVFSVDGEIDRKEREIEALCMRLLLQQQPVARDLRQISSALKMISDMERIGDQASDIAEISEYLIGTGVEKQTKIDKMAAEAIKMVTDSINSYVKHDIDLAHKVIEYDDIVDGYFIEIKNEIIELIAKGETNGEYSIDLLMIAKYLERIGDHATNIAEWVEYSITGVHKDGGDQEKRD